MIKKIYKVIKKKHKIAKTRWKWWWEETPLTYLNELLGEVEEVKQELGKEKNMVYLEDELGDILWDYLNVLWLLDKEWKIKKWRILKKSYKKFEERIDAIWEKWMSWKEIKEKQKLRLEKRHKNMYWK